MENIVTPTDDYSFKDIVIKTPKALQGGTYCANLEMHDRPIIIQTPKCKTKNGIHKTAKQIYCDILIKNDEIDFLNWFEKFQERIRELILENSSNWFHEEITLDDIEFNWNNSLRSYKGKQLLRTFVHKNKRMNKLSLQIYDTDENELTINDVTEDKKVISIIEIVGLKFSSQSFHLEICLRQLMVINEKPIFNKCLIKLDNSPKMIKFNKIADTIKTKQSIEDDEEKNNTKNNYITANEEEQNNEELVNDNEEQNNKELIDNKESTDNLENITVDKSTNDDKIVDETNKDKIESPNNNDIEDNDVNDVEDNNVNEELVDSQNANECDMDKEIINSLEKSNELFENNKNMEKEMSSNLQNSDNIEEKETVNEIINSLETTNNLEKSNDLEEIELSYDNLDTIKLKNPNEVYLDIYKAAREKAKKAKNEAIKAYLEAKKIKELYMLDIIDSSDEDDEESNLFSEN